MKAKIIMSIRKAVPCWVDKNLWKNLGNGSLSNAYLMNKSELLAAVFFETSACNRLLFEIIAPPIKICNKIAN